MKTFYPESFETLNAWAQVNGVGADEARVRFVQSTILKGVAASRELGRALVFKGGNALDFIWEPNRSTSDLDFSVDASALDEPLQAARLRRLLITALNAQTSKSGVVFLVHSVEQRPPGPDCTFATFRVRIGYALPNDTRAIARLQAGRPSVHVIPMDVSLNEPICSVEIVDLGDNQRLLTSTLEDIVAEKLRAFLQQRPRNRIRSQDLLDVAVVVRNNPNINISKVSDHLIRKSAARNIWPSREGFHDPELAERARSEYDRLESTTRNEFIPFEEALAVLLEFVSRLDIPDQPGPDVSSS